MQHFKITLINVNEHRAYAHTVQMYTSLSIGLLNIYTQDIY